MSLPSLAGREPLTAQGPSLSPFRLLQKDTAKFAVARLGFNINAPQDQQRADSVIAAFFRGYNTVLADRSEAGVQQMCEAMQPFYRPFAYEGAALGYFVRTFMHPAPGRYAELIESLCQIHPGYLYLYYMGLGFGCGILLGWWPGKAERIIQSLPYQYRHLCYDGFGFQSGLLNFLPRPKVMRRFHKFQDEFGVHCCYQGFGRSLRFIHFDRPDLVQSTIEGLEKRFHGDCYSGLGLAFGFTHIDRLGSALDYSKRLQGRQARIDFFTGTALALWARRLNNPSYFHEQVAALESRPRKWAERLIEHCDECNEAVDLSAADAYFQWRSCVRGKVSQEGWS